MFSAADQARVHELLPHRGPMCWLERVVNIDAECVVAEAVVRDTSLFLDGGRLPIWIGIEYMAQAVAAWAGHRARGQGRGVAVGYLVGTRRYDVFRSHLEVGEHLTIEARCEILGANGLGVFACRLLVAGELAASANLSVYEPPVK